MPKAGLPMGFGMRHDSHYVDQIAQGREVSAARYRSIRYFPILSSLEPNLATLRSSRNRSVKRACSNRFSSNRPKIGRFMIIAGERRWRSSQLAGLTEVPCIEMDIDEKGIAEIALIENLQRKDLNIWEEADGLAALAAKFGYTQDEIAKKISKSRSTVTELMTIAGLPADIRARCRDAAVNSKSALLEVAWQFDDAAMHEFIDGVTSGAVVPKSKQPRNGKQGEGKPAGTTGESYTFNFKGKDPGFDLSINFSDRMRPSRAELLKALKLTFDAVKSESAQL